VLAAEAKMKAIQEERELLAAEEAATPSAGGGGGGKWGSSVAADVDEDAEKLESAKAGAAAAASGTLLSLPLLLSQSTGTLVTLESVAGVAVSCLLFGGGSEGKTQHHHPSPNEPTFDVKPHPHTLVESIQSTA
jgi:hypothetical protein